MSFPESALQEETQELIDWQVDCPTFLEEGACASCEENRPPLEGS